jgi:hypothetical protein
MSIEATHLDKEKELTNNEGKINKPGLGARTTLTATSRGTFQAVGPMEVKLKEGDTGRIIWT